MNSIFPDNIKQLVYDGNFELALDELQKENKKFLSGKCLIHMGRYKDAIDLLNVLPQDFNTLIALAEANLRLGETNKASLYIDKLDNEENLFEYHRIKALQYWFNGDLRNAQAETKLSLEYHPEDGFLINLIGITELRLGNLDSSRKYFQKIIDNKLTGKQQIAIALVNIGASFLQQGLLDISLKQYKTGSDILKKIGNKRHLADTLRSIGQIYHRKGDLPASLAYLLQSLKIREKLANPLEIAESLFWIIIVRLESNYLVQAESIIEELSKIEKRVGNDIVSYRYKLVLAQLLGKSNRICNMGDSINLLKYLLKQHIVDHELMVICHLSYLELLIRELQMTSENEVIEDIKEITDKLLEIARHQNSYSLLAETYWLQSQMALIRGDIQKCKNFMMQATLIADEKGFEPLARKISSVFYEFLQKEDDYSKISLDERIQLLSPQIGKLSTQIRTKSEIKPIQEMEEIAIKLMILSTKSGIAFYSYSFTEKKYEITDDEMFMASFLNAMQKFSGRLFSRSLDQIKLSEFTLLILSDKEFTVCYIYKGQSHRSQLKLLDLKEAIIQSSKISDSIKIINNIGKQIDEDIRSQLDLLVIEIFTQKSSK